MRTRREECADERQRSVAQAGDPWNMSSAIIHEIQDETPGVTTYRFGFKDSDATPYWKALPGQFNMLYVPGVGEAAISVSGDLAISGQIIHTIRNVGNVTGAIAQLKVGQTLGMRGPFGSAWPIDQCVGQDVILMGGGIGLAPLRPVVYEIIRRRREFSKVHLLIGARTPDDLLYRSEYDLWRTSGVEVEFTVDRADSTWTGNIGVVTLLFERLSLSRIEATSVMTCGPEVMMMYAIQSAISRGIDTHHLWLSLERNMNCAVGSCGHCQFGPHFICKDGPVLRYDRVASLMEISDL